MFIPLLICLSLAGSLYPLDQSAPPYLLGVVESSIHGVWYPAAGLVVQSSYYRHQSLQAEFLSGIRSSSSRLLAGTALPIVQGRRFKLVLLYLCMLLIVRSCDIEMNPGPYTPKYPCGVCNKAVRWSRTRTAVACDTCDTWYHCDCLGMSNESYDRLNRSDVIWICSSCDKPNYSTSLLDSFTSVSSNPFISISNIDHAMEDEGMLDSAPSVAALSNSDLGSPVSCSSPIGHPPSGNRHNRRKNAARPLKIISVNLQSFNAKKEAFWEAVDSSQPDIIIANETWLKPHLA